MKTDTKILHKAQKRTNKISLRVFYSKLLLLQCKKTNCNAKKKGLLIQYMIVLPVINIAFNKNFGVDLF